MKPAKHGHPRHPRRGPRPTILAATLIAVAAAASVASAAEPFLVPNATTYFPGEDIIVAFGNGPGNSKDWIGVYPIDIVPGAVASTIWRYVDGTQGGTQGLTEGSVTFPGGLNLAGDWAMYFLLNDGYTGLATNLFRVVEPGSPVVRLDRRVVTVGEAITLAFTNGPANAKDWIGFYRSGQTPGPNPSTVWSYVDGTQVGNTAQPEGAITFPGGLPSAGEWIVHFLANDGYDILASETLTVRAPAATVPRVLSLTPSNGSINQPPLLQFEARITNGTTRVVASSIVLRLDGTIVTPQIGTADGLTTVTYTDGGLPGPQSTHQWVLTFNDDAVPANEVRAETGVTIGSYRNIVLSNPVVFENFDSVPEGSLPAGWTEKGYSTPINETLDFGDLGSAAYRTWTTVNADRFAGSFVTYGNPENPAGWGTDYQRVNRVNPFNVINGQVLQEPLARGRFLFGNSGYQNGSASQVLYLFTPDFNLTGKTNIHVGFKSLWEQNQDSIAAIEYSIDGGQSWLPVAYFIDNPDIVRLEDGTIDAETTLTTERGDVARYVDDQGNEIGGTYGAFIGAPIGPDLAPYLQGRVDDNPVESKRVEWFRLERADNQSRVRLRFAHAGTDSWYFGIDDFGLYAPTSEAGPAPTLTVRREGSSLVISWPASATGYVLESTAAIGSAWVPVNGVTGTSHTVTPSAAAGFYRLRRS